MHFRCPCITTLPSDLLNPQFGVMNLMSMDLSTEQRIANISTLPVEKQYVSFKNDIIV